MIHIHCPHCHSRLEIDPGFAGGICRCFNCGTLMTVPNDHSRQVEQLQRPSRPERPESPDPMAPAPVEQHEAHIFVTRSGRRINLDPAGLEHVPVARKPRMGLRIGIIAAFVVFVAFLLVGLIYLMQAMSQSPPQVPDEQVGQTVTVNTLGYDPQANPYLLNRPNFFGLPVQPGRLAVVIDASARMGRLLDSLKDLLACHVRTLGPQITFQAVLATADGAKALPDSPTVASQIDPEPFNRSLDSIRPGGRLALHDSSRAALAGKPDRLILVVAYPPAETDLAAMPGLLESFAGRLDVILLGPDIPALRALAEQHQGRCLTIASGQVQRWHDQFLSR